MSGILETLGAVDWGTVLGTTPLEITATVCAVAGVFCIARQKILGWPLGLVWAGISAYLAFTQWNLVSDGILYASYLPIQIYCWILWAWRGRPGAEAPFVPAWTSRRTQGLLALAAAASILLWGLGVKTLAEIVPGFPKPSLLWLDATTTVLNYYSQFLQARKRMENWVGWLIVNVLGIYIYWVKDSPVYSIQYAFFLGLGLYGWFQWRKNIRSQAAAERKTP